MLRATSSSASFALRRAHRDDAPALAAVRRQAILTLATPEMGQGRAEVWADSAAADRVVRAIELHEVWVADCADAPGGWVEIDRDRVEGIYVRPELARSGVGSALLLHAEDRIRSAGYRAALLDASPNAEEFYLRRGYQPRGEPAADAAQPMLKPLGGTAS